MGKNTATGILLIMVAVLMIGIILFADKLKTSGMSLSEIIGGIRAPGETPPQENYVPDEILVRFNPGVSGTVQDSISKRYGSVKEEIPQIKVKVLKVNPEAQDAVIEALSHNPAVEFAEKNYIAQAFFDPNDPGFVNQWGMKTINAQYAWNVTKGNSDVKIAILDTGIDMDHPDLAGKIVSATDFTGSPNSYNDTHGHGTHCAGIAAARTNNGIGVAGVCPDCSLMNVKVLGDTGSGSLDGVANGIIWAADNGANVISMSLGTTFAPSSSTLESAVNYAWSKGAVLVCAAGNNGNDVRDYPAYYRNCIAVAATDDTDNLAYFSTYGNWVDVAAPGATIYSTIKDDWYAYKSGTSMAAPHVAGLAGLVFTKVQDATKVRSCIETTADNKGSYSISGGRINAYNAVQCSSSSPSNDITPPIVSITSPINNAIVSNGITILVSASDNIVISKIELYIDGALFATDLSSPYSFYWDTTPADNGQHILTAKAYDSSNNFAISTITVTVSTSVDTILPTINIGPPTNGTTISGIVTIKAYATDNRAVKSVELYIDNILKSSSTSQSITYSWNVKTNKVKSGPHTITAKAYDTTGNVGTSSVTVNKL